MNNETEICNFINDNNHIKSNFKFDYASSGIALGSGLIHILEKFILMAYVYRKLKIPPQSYIPIGWYAFYSILIGVVFILIDHRILYFV
ncbi:MAG: hypothetical protein LBV39_03350 [Bacteroidales bacterium]|jgi:hypothetical protein|nr:hypothetical protein [Bacteroidales bacterium]